MSIVESKCNFININVIEYNFKIKFEDLRIYLKCLCVYYSWQFWCLFNYNYVCKWYLEFRCQLDGGVCCIE